LEKKEFFLLFLCRWKTLLKFRLCCRPLSGALCKCISGLTRRDAFIPSALEKTKFCLLFLRRWLVPPFGTHVANKKLFVSNLMGLPSKK
jgi:hypothetical protein